MTSHSRPTTLLRVILGVLGLMMLMLHLVQAQSCDENEAAICTPALDECLLAEPTSNTAACACYKEFGECYRRARCFDIPDDNFKYCRETLLCAESTCDGSSATTATLAAAAGLTIMMVMWKLSTDH